MNKLTQHARLVCQQVLERAGKDLLRIADRMEPDPGSTLTKEQKELLARNAVFRDRHAGKRCFVIGNGPSVATQDLVSLGNEITFVMSAFWKHPVVEHWQPTYYCFADRVFFDGSATMQQFFEQMTGRIRDTTYLVPLHAAAWVSAQRVLPPDRSYYVKFHERARSVDLTAPILPPQSVALLCITAAIYMGCSPIYLLGLDHDWLAHRGQDRHFYAGKTVDNHKVAHGDLAKTSYRIDMESQLKLWHRYEILAECARRDNIAILNATNGGFLDIFPRVRYEDVVDPEQPPQKGVRGAS